MDEVVAGDFDALQGRVRRKLLNISPDHFRRRSDFGPEEFGLQGHAA